MQVFVQQHIDNAAPVVTGKVDGNQIRLRHERSGKADIVHVTNHKVYIVDKIGICCKHASNQTLHRGAGFLNVLQGSENGCRIVAHNPQAFDLRAIYFACCISKQSSLPFALV